MATLHERLVNFHVSQKEILAPLDFYECHLQYARIDYLLRMVAWFCEW